MSSGSRALMRNIGNYFLDSAYSLSVNCNTESFYNFVAMKPPHGAHLQLFFEIKGREIRLAIANTLRVAYICLSYREIKREI